MPPDDANGRGTEDPDHKLSPLDHALLERLREQEDRLRDYEQRRRVIRVVDSLSEQLDRDRHFSALVPTVMMALAGLFGVAIYAVSQLDLLGSEMRPFTIPALAFLLGLQVAAALTLLFVRRRRREQSFHLQAILSVVRRELDGTWERVDSLQTENRLLKDKRNRLAHGNADWTASEWRQGLSDE